MMFCKRLSAMALTLAMFCGSSYASLSSDLLKNVPSNIELLVVTSSLSELHGNVTGLLEPFGVDTNEISPDKFTEVINDKLGLSDPVEIDMSLPAGVAITNIMAANNSVVVYLPIVDAASTVSSLPEQLESGMAKLSDGIFVANKGKYVLIGNNEYNLSLVLKSEASFSPDKAILSDLESSDISIYANLTNLMNVARFMIPAALMNVPEFQNNSDLMQSVQGFITKFTEIDKISYGIDIDDRNVSVKTNMYFIPTGQVAKVLNSSDKIALSQFKTFPNGDASFLTAIKANQEQVEYFFQTIIEMTAIGNAQSPVVNNDEVIKGLTELFEVFVDKYIDKIDSVVNVDYMTDSDVERMEEKLITIGKSSLDYELSKQIWEDVEGNENLGSVLNVNELKLDKGQISGCKYSMVDIDFVQSMPNSSVVKNNMKIYFGYTSGYNVQALSEELFSEVVELANSKSTLAENELLQKAVKYLPDEANCYFVVDLDVMASIFLDSFNRQAAQISQSNPDMASAMAFTGPIINIIEGLEGSAGVSVEIADGHIRTVSYVDSETIDSIGTIAKNAAAMFGGGMQMPNNGNSKPAKEF